MSDQETATIVVMRTSDAKKIKIDLCMSSSLNDLKSKIDESTEFGPLPRTNQRLFHLGRELKTGGRSLAALGVGRFKCFTVHLLAKETAAGEGETNTKNGKKKADDGDNNEVVEVARKRRTRQSAQAATASNSSRRRQQVIELGDSDDDDEDDEVEVVAAPPRRKRTRRQN